MTICLVAGTLLVLSVIAGLPEITEGLDRFFTASEGVVVESQEAYDFVEGIELYGPFWFLPGYGPKRRVWRQKNAKCAWSPLPPGMFAFNWTEDFAWGT